MFSQLSIVNNVLNELGRNAVTAISDGDDSRLIANKLNLLLPKLLMLTDWNFAIKYRSDSTPLSSAFSPEWQYSYMLPPDFGQIDRFYQMRSPYRLLDGMILSNQNPAQYYYVVNNADYAVLTPMFADALVKYCASEVCLVLTEDTDLTAYLLEKYQQAANAAVIQNDQQRMIIGRPFNDYARVTYV